MESNKTKGQPKNKKIVRRSIKKITPQKVYSGTKKIGKSLVAKQSLASVSLHGIRLKLEAANRPRTVIWQQTPLSSLTIPKWSSPKHHPRPKGGFVRKVLKNKNGQKSIWDTAIIYQLYPRSFHEKRATDESHIGEGTILGIIDKIDYLHALNVDIIWLSPFYPSPMIDSGYDVSDYCNVDPRYGTLADFDALISKAHQKGMSIMIDFVPNHSSDQHPWFIDSASSKDNPKSDWYIWRDAKNNGQPPNNWASVFSLPQLEKRRKGELNIKDGYPTPPLSAWQWHEGRQQYYLHTFAKEQPDLNWSNSDVRKAMLGNLRFWLGRGVDGFRVDAVNHIGKNMSLLDEPANPDYVEGVDNPYDQLLRINSANYKTLDSYINDLTSVLNEDKYKKRDLFMVLEAYAPQDVLDRINIIDPENCGAFNFSRMRAPWDADAHRELIENYLESLPAKSIANHVSGNHDNSRLASRIGLAAARANSVIDACLPGQMYIYNGEEAGLLDVEVPHELRNDKLGMRDSARTPIPWDNSIHGGFSVADNTWLPVTPDYTTQNIVFQAMQKDSTLSHYRRLLNIRKNLQVLNDGYYKELQTDSDENVFAFSRISDKQKVMIITNFSNEKTTVKVNNPPFIGAKTIFSSRQRALPKVNSLSNPIVLDPNESLIIGTLNTYLSLQIRMLG